MNKFLDNYFQKFLKQHNLKINFEIISEKEIIFNEGRIKLENVFIKIEQSITLQLAEIKLIEELNKIINTEIQEIYKYNLISNEIINIYKPDINIEIPYSSWEMVSIKNQRFHINYIFPSEKIEIKYLLIDDNNTYESYKQLLNKEFLLKLRTIINTDIEKLFTVKATDFENNNITGV